MKDEIVAFIVQSDLAGWRVTNGNLEFGPYSTQAKAQDAAQSLSYTYSRFEDASAGHGGESLDAARASPTDRALSA